MSLEIQNRDIRVLKFVFASRVALFDQVARSCFQKCHRKIAFRRISLLVRAGLLTEASVVVNYQTRKILLSTQKGWNVIREQWAWPVDFPHFKSESPIHDVRLNEIRMRFEQLRTFQHFITENLLQSSTQFAEDKNLSDLVKLQADGALILKAPDGDTYVYSIEFEVSNKGAERYQQKLSQYYGAAGFNGVIYICANQQIAAVLARVDPVARRNECSILHAGLENDVLQVSDRIYFKNVQGKGIALF